MPLCNQRANSATVKQCGNKGITFQTMQDKSCANIVCLTANSSPNSVPPSGRSSSIYVIAPACSQPASNVTGADNHQLRAWADISTNCSSTHNRTRPPHTAASGTASSAGRGVPGACAVEFCRRAHLHGIVTATPCRYVSPSLPLRHVHSSAATTIAATPCNTIATTTAANTDLSTASLLNSSADTTIAATPCSTISTTTPAYTELAVKEQHINTTTPASPLLDTVPDVHPGSVSTPAQAHRES